METFPQFSPAIFAQKETDLMSFRHLACRETASAPNLASLNERGEDGCRPRMETNGAQTLNVCGYWYIYVYIYIHTYIHTYIHIYILIYIYIFYIFLFIYLFVYLSICAFICTGDHRCTCIHTSIYIYICFQSSVATCMPLRDHIQ